MAKRLSLDDFTLSAAGFKAYNEGGSNRADIRRMKKFINEAVKIELTEKQRRYLTEYYVDGKKMREIAEDYGVCESNISKTIKRAVSKLKTRAVYLDMN